MTNKLKDRRIPISTRGVVRIGILSLVIGVACTLILAGHLPYSVASWGSNIGYSLMLGFGLFANGHVYHFIEKNNWINWLKRPIKSLIVSFCVTTIYSSIVIWFTNWFWFGLIQGLTWGEFIVFGRTIIITNYITLYIISLFFYARGFFRDWKRSIVAEQELKQEALNLQYKVLSNQVNPHFLFNSLNVLSSLIRLDTNRAEVFVNKLSNFYRDLLSFRGKDIVLLKEEVGFVNQYLDLQKERFGDKIYVETQVVDLDKYQIIPMTLQMLVENAIKHNQIVSDNVLKIRIYSNGNYLVVKNSLKPYLNPQDGERLGLQNLNERYKFLTDYSLKVEKSDEFFIVKVPLLKMEEAKN